MGNLYGARGQFKLLQQCGFEKRAARVNIVNNASTLNEFQQEEFCGDGVFHQLFSQTICDVQRGAQFSSLAFAVHVVFRKSSCNPCTSTCVSDCQDLHV